MRRFTHQDEDQGNVIQPAPDAFFQPVSSASKNMSAGRNDVVSDEPRASRSASIQNLKYFLRNKLLEFTVFQTIAHSVVNTLFLLFACQEQNGDAAAKQRDGKVFHARPHIQRVCRPLSPIW